MKEDILNQLTGEDIHEIWKEYRNYEWEYIRSNGPVVLVDDKEMAKEVLNRLRNNKNGKRN